MPTPGASKPGRRAAVSEGEPLSPPDAVLRTSGELRLSNFLLWQTAYAEFHFTDDLWPDFSPARLKEAMVWFAGRDRRFGSSAPL